MSTRYSLAWNVPLQLSKHGTSLLKVRHHLCKQTAAPARCLSCLTNEGCVLTVHRTTVTTAVREHNENKMKIAAELQLLRTKGALKTQSSLFLDLAIVGKIAVGIVYQVPRCPKMFQDVPSTSHLELRKLGSRIVRDYHQCPSSSQFVFSTAQVKPATSFGRAPSSCACQSVVWTSQCMATHGLQWLNKSFSGACASREWCLMDSASRSACSMEALDLSVRCE